MQSRVIEILNRSLKEFPNSIRTAANIHELIKLQSNEDGTTEKLQVDLEKKGGRLDNLKAELIE